MGLLAGLFIIVTANLAFAFVVHRSHVISDVDVIQ
jgi:hypothetical protein